MKLIDTVKCEARSSAKWAAIIFVPVLLLVAIVSGMLGGIEGDGKLLLLIALAPMMLVGERLAVANPFLAWPAALLIEFVYFFIMVFACRLLRVHVLVIAAGRKVLPYLKAKPPPQS